MYKNYLLTLISCFIVISQAQADESYAVFDDFDDTIYINIVERIEGDTIFADFVVSSFIEISAFQFTIDYDNGFNLLAVQEGEVNGVFNANFPNSIAYTWFDPTALSVSLDDGAVLFTLLFSTDGIAFPNTRISSSIIEVEVINADLEQVVLNANGTNIAYEFNLIKGAVYIDSNENCVLDEGETQLRDWIISLDNGILVKTDHAGNYRRYIDSGEYRIKLEVKNELWSTCNEGVDLSVTGSGTDVYNINFGVQPKVECSRPEISAAVPFLRRCVDNRYYFTYCNYGTKSLEAPEIIINHSQDFIYKFGSIAPEKVEDESLIIIGEDIGIAECKTLHIDFEVDCQTTELGETHCVEASIGPFDNCIQSQNWSGADIVVDVECEDDRVNFIIKNKGAGNMGSTRSFIVIEDDVMAPQPDEDYDIDAGDSILVGFPANGKTLRLIAQQVENHPFPNMPTAAIEGCGTDSDGNSSQGFVNQFAESDNAPFTDKYCTAIIGAFDPNDKQGFPRGYGEENFIYKDTDMEYLIRFQNTGNDTAFNVVITDSLRHELDLRSIQVGPASHPYNWEIQNERTLVFKFTNILLPDSNVNLLGSNGFIKYKVRQTASHEDGVKITNDAAIFFDFNEPIYTNVTEHVIGSEFIISDIIENNPLAYESYLIYPNPSRDGIWIERKIKEGNLELKIFGADGRQTHQQILSNHLNYISSASLSNGLNFYNITTADGRTYSGKILILN